MILEKSIPNGEALLLDISANTISYKGLTKELTKEKFVIHGYKMESMEGQLYIKEDLNLPLLGTVNLYKTTKEAVKLINQAKKQYMEVAFVVSILVDYSTVVPLFSLFNKRYSSVNKTMVLNQTSLTEFNPKDIICSYDHKTDFKKEPFNFITEIISKTKKPKPVATKVKVKKAVTSDDFRAVFENIVGSRNLNIFESKLHNVFSKIEYRSELSREQSIIVLKGVSDFLDLIPRTFPKNASKLFKFVIYRKSVESTKSLAYFENATSTIALNMNNSKDITVESVRNFLIHEYGHFLDYRLLKQPKLKEQRMEILRLLRKEDYVNKLRINKKKSMDLNDNNYQIYFTYRLEGDELLADMFLYTILTLNKQPVYTRLPFPTELNPSIQIYSELFLKKYLV